MTITQPNEQSFTATNKRFAIAGVPPINRGRLCFADTFPAKAGQVMQGGSSVLRMKFSAKHPAIANPRKVRAHPHCHQVSKRHHLE
jgi:hypothetical protein